MLLRWVGLIALFVAVATDTWLRPALTVSGILWSLAASVALYRETGGTWVKLAFGAAALVSLLLTILWMFMS
jgi:hypothetical protein